MAFAQLTYRESLRDIEVCLRAHQSKLYHMGIRSASIARNTLSKANERRDWRIYADFAQALIRVARPLYANEDLGLDLDNTVYALDASTIDLCLSVFPWALFRSTKSAVKLHTLLDLRGIIPTFIHISDGKLHDVNVLDILLPEAGAFYIMDRGYVDFARLFTLNTTGASFVIRAKSNTQYRRRYSHPLGGSEGVKCDQTIVLTGVNANRDYPPPSPDQILRRTQREALQLPDQQFCHPCTDRGLSIPLSLASGTLLQMDQTTPTHQILFRHLRECREEPNLDCHLRLCPGRYHQKAVKHPSRSLHHSAGFEPDAIRENSITSIAYWSRLHHGKSRSI